MKFNLSLCLLLLIFFVKLLWIAYLVWCQFSSRSVVGKDLIYTDDACFRLAPRVYLVTFAGLELARRTPQILAQCYGHGLVLEDFTVVLV
jgi:hypothetical protein